MKKVLFSLLIILIVLSCSKFKGDKKGDLVYYCEDYKEAEDFIDFALTVKGSDKAILYLKKAILNEQLKDYKTALTFIKLAKEHTFNSEFMADIVIEKDRIKGKMPKKKKVKAIKKQPNKAKKVKK